MSYREPPSTDPLIVSHGMLLTAVDPTTGRMHWQHRLSHAATRHFRVGQRLLVGDTASRAEDARLRCFELVTGKELGQVALGFGIDTGFVAGGLLYVAGGSGFACVNADGAIVWKALRIMEAGWLSGKTALVCTDANGIELWRTEEPGPTFIGEGQGLLLGELVAQPDAYGAGTRD